MHMQRMTEVTLIHPLIYRQLLQPCLPCNTLCQTDGGCVRMHGDAGCFRLHFSCGAVLVRRSA
jgi:hypothetical protein